MDNNFDLQREILDELDWEPSVNAAEIGVAVNDGVVTLTGVVDSYAEKWMAENAVKRVRGVKAVAEELEVRVPTLMKRSDTDIARAAVLALDWSSVVPKDRVKVKIENGWLTLDGELPWGYQREAAASAVRNLSGVRGVTNLITIKPKVAVKPIKERLVGAFRRSAELDAGRIKIDASDGKVTLSGTVHSWTEWREAARVAWAAPGVSRVDNKLNVSL